jgi:hypothetical protein
MDLGIIDLTSAGELKFGIQAKPIKGMHALLQLVILTMLTNSGSDIFDAFQGAGLGGLIGKYNLNLEDMTEVTSDISVLIDSAQSQIIANQAGLDIPAEEKLRKIDIVSVLPDPDGQGVKIRIRVENNNGRSKDVVI